MLPAGVLSGLLLATVLVTSGGVARAQMAPTQAPAAAPAAPPVPGGGAAAARFVIKVEKGFIDDHFDLVTEAKVLAVLLTDAASFARVDLVDLETGKPRRTIEIGDPQRMFERVLVAGGGEMVVLVSRDAGNGRRSAQLYDSRGRPAGILGPVDDISVATHQGKRVLVAVSRAGSGKAITYKVARHRLEGLGRVGPVGSFVIEEGKDLREPPLKMVGWQRNYTELVGMRPGGYDKARDVRLPSRAAVLDTSDGRFTFEADIGDVMAWAAASELRRKFPGRGLFAVFTPDAQQFELIDFQGRRTPIKLPVPLRYYDPTSLQEHEQLPPAGGPGGSLLFSLAIDPLHSEALARRKKDPSFLDLYIARPDAAAPSAATGKAALGARFERVLRAPMDDRPVGWVAAGSHAAILRKHKNFSRGGNLLEVYPLERAVSN